jgi:hypothetical protein
MFRYVCFNLVVLYCVRFDIGNHITGQIQPHYLTYFSLTLDSLTQNLIPFLFVSVTFVQCLPWGLSVILFEEHG